MEQPFDGAVKTTSGAETKNVKFNASLGFYTGKVYDKGSYLPDKFVSGTWDKRGKCKNRLRSDLDLVKPEAVKG